MLAVLAFLGAHRAETAALVYALANLANALIKDPVAKGTLAKFVDFFSVLTRADAEGTVKVPLRASKAKALPPSLRSVAVLALMLSVASCAAMKQIGINLAQCVVGQVPSAVAGIVPDVSAVLGGASPDWQQDLAAIGARAGVDALACAVKSIVSALSAKREGAPLSPNDGKARERGMIWLAAHGVK